jgi:hypothetical protein
VVLGDALGTFCAVKEDERAAYKTERNKANRNELRRDHKMNRSKQVPDLKRIHNLKIRDFFLIRGVKIKDSPLESNNVESKVYHRTRPIRHTSLRERGSLSRTIRYKIRGIYLTQKGIEHNINLSLYLHN